MKEKSKFKITTMRPQYTQDEIDQAKLEVIKIILEHRRKRLAGLLKLSNEAKNGKEAKGKTV